MITERLAVVALAFASAACSNEQFTLATDAARSDAPTTSDADTGDDASMGDDAAADGGKADADVTAVCPSGQVFCNGACVAGNDCQKCTNKPLFCAATRSCSATCAACMDSQRAPQPIECFACNATQALPIGTCAANAPTKFCLNGNYASAYPGTLQGKHCDCDNTNVQNCPGDNQVCLPAGATDNCTTCGENGVATHGVVCKGGGTCNALMSPPRCL